MPSSAADSSNTSFETSSKNFSRSRKIVTERAVIGAAVCISVAMASMVPTSLLKHREYELIGWAEHLTLASTNRSITLEITGSSEIGNAFGLSLGSV